MHAPHPSAARRESPEMNKTMLVAALLAATLPAAQATAQGGPTPAQGAPATQAAPAAGQPAPAAVQPAPAAVQSTLAGDAAKGRNKTQMCQGCHGIDGWRTAYPEVYMVPRLGSQHEAYLLKALQEYKSGQRSHPSMRAIAASLSDQDMADLAAYYAQGATKTAGK